MYSSDLARQTFYAFCVECGLDQSQLFIDRIAERAPDVLAGSEYLGELEKVARALVQLKPRQLIECLYGQVPTGFLGLLSRLGGDPLCGKETYRNAFELFSNPRHRQRAKVLGQLPGRITPEQIAVAAGITDVLIHRVVIERCRIDEVLALNAFVKMITDLCNATPASIRQSLDKLNVGTTGVGMGEWAQGWLARQVRLPFDPPIPFDDPDLKLRLGVELTSLGRRMRNCAGHRQSYSFLSERLIYEWTGAGGPAVLEFLRLTSGTEVRLVCEDLRAPRNRRVSPELATVIQLKLDAYGILYQSLTHPTGDEQALHKLLDHTTPFAWDVRREGADHENGDADIDRMLDELEQEIHDREAA
uniref:Uncharacterized protein n=1 Tax=Bosea sp. NBC_00436 TaxID=2969620 RepID=A0A9E7ZHM0_9HYPH